MLLKVDPTEKAKDKAPVLLTQSLVYFYCQANSSDKDILDKQDIRNKRFLGFNKISISDISSSKA